LLGGVPRWLRLVLGLLALCSEAGVRRGVACAYQARLVGEYYGLGAVAESELCEDATHVGLHGCLTEDEAVGDFAIAQAAG
jgi:hypothetical protein